MAVETGRPQDLDPDTVAAAAEEQGKPKMLPAHPKLRTPPKMAGFIGLGLSDASTGKARQAPRALWRQGHHDRGPSVEVTFLLSLLSGRDTELHFTGLQTGKLTCRIAVREC